MLELLGLGNQGQRNGEDGGRGIKSLGKETQGQTHGGERYGRRVTRRQIIVRTPGGRDEGIRVMETDGGSETQRNAGIKTLGDRAAGREMQGTRDSNRDSWEREISGARDMEGERIRAERGILRLRQGTQSKEPDQGGSGSGTDGVKGGVMAW